MTVAARPRVPLVRAWLLSSGAAAVAGAVAGAVLARATGTDPAFMPLTPGPIVFFTFLFGGAATLVYREIVRRAADPRRRWLQVAAVAAVLSLAPDLLMAVDPAGSPVPGATAEAGLALAVLHLLAAPVIALGLLRLAPPERG